MAAAKWEPSHGSSQPFFASRLSRLRRTVVGSSMRKTGRNTSLERGSRQKVLWGIQKFTFEEARLLCTVYFASECSADKLFGSVRLAISTALVKILLFGGFNTFH